jgi:two-component system, LytTR family, response regulator
MLREIEARAATSIIRTMLADDEVLARQKLRGDLKEIEGVEVIGECASARETIEFARLTNPDLLLLDIRLPDMDGFDVVAALSAMPDRKRPQFVFVTAHDRYAIRAFEVHAADYLLKPYSFERLRTAVDRVRDLHGKRGKAKLSSGGLNGNGLSQSDEQTQKTTEQLPTQLVFKSRGRILFVPLHEIHWIQAEENYVRIRTRSESYFMRESIGHLENRLHPDSFLRVHRSAIVNLQYIREIRSEPQGNANVILKCGETIPMSRSYRTQIQDLLKI